MVHFFLCDSALMLRDMAGPRFLRDIATVFGGGMFHTGYRIESARVIVMSVNH